MFVSDGLVEQHIHGAFGYDFMNCSVEDVLVDRKRKDRGDLPRGDQRVQADREDLRP